MGLWCGADLPGLTVSAHALRQTLLQAAVLAAVAAGPIDLAVTLSGAGIRHSGHLTAPEKSLREKKNTSYISTKKQKQTQNDKMNSNFKQNFCI